MQARQIMTTPVLTVRPDTTVREAATLLLEHRITAAPVLDAGGELIGIVSEGDLVVDRFGHDPRNQVRPVQDDGADAPDLRPLNDPPVRHVRKIDDRFIGAAPGIDDGADQSVSVQLPILGESR